MKIVIGGQVDKKDIELLVKEFGEGVETEVKPDMDAALAVKSGQADYYVGACSTGGGGALAMAIAMLGREKCETVSMPGRKPDPVRIQEAVNSGKKAFGFTADHKEESIQYIMEALKA